MTIETHSLGTLIESNFFLGLLGGRKSQIEDLKQSFPKIQFKRIKQVHGDRIIHTSPHSIDFSSEADAHYTNEKNLGLCISTADCIPLILFHSDPFWISIVHAGWRGVEKRIVPKTIAHLKKLGCQPEKLQILVGPHIQKSSFEVENKVRDQLLKSCAGSDSSFWERTSEDKSKVDLSLILKSQLNESKVDLGKAFFEVKDTVTGLEYHSYRRDKENSGRQLSFISLK
jgi:YfiH family protein